MARQGPESRLTSQILKDLRGRGGFWFKVVGGPYQKAGLPDIVGCYQGKFVGLEVKLPGEPHPLTELQRQTLMKIASAGGVTGVVHSVDEAIGVVHGGRPLWEVLDDEGEPQLPPRDQ